MTHRRDISCYTNRAVIRESGLAERLLECIVVEDSTTEKQPQVSWALRYRASRLVCMAVTPLLRWMSGRDYPGTI